MEATLIFPHQLFSDHPALKKDRPVYLVEDDLFFSQYAFHKQKLILHRASMKFYEQYLQTSGFTVTYIDHAVKGALKATFSDLHTKGITVLHYADTVDYLLERRLKRYAKHNNLTLEQYPSPNFICTTDFIDTFFANKKRYFQTEFYIDLRKQKQILLAGENPVGGSWTYDVLNRKKLPAGTIVPARKALPVNVHVREAKDYVTKNFPNHYGSAEGFNYPTTYDEAASALDHFLHNRFENYGDYQDAIDTDDSFLFHSVLTPALNIGLLQPSNILNKALLVMQEKNIPLNSAEGFIRQILGWREFIRAVYIREGVHERTTNYFNHHRKIPSSFYTGTTGIEPVDRVIQRLLKTGYSNHIERLMILGNFMILCEFDPDDVYRWFMELYIDAYDWVMVPNVYGMSQFADGGLMATKPYISGSNYILKMSHYKKGDWCTVWDGLYWRFIDTHKHQFSKNPRMSMMVKLLEKMEPQKKARLVEAAENFLTTLA